MKKKQPELKKLKLNKERIVNLTQMQAIIGGIDDLKYKQQSKTCPNDSRIAACTQSGL